MVELGQARATAEVPSGWWYRALGWRPPSTRRSPVPIGEPYHLDGTVARCGARGGGGKTARNAYYRAGSSDKVYQAAIEPAGHQFVVNFAYGRRGTTLTTGTKTSSPVDYADAKKIYTKLVGEKKAKGYTEGGAKIPWATTLGGTYEHASAQNNKAPFELPKIWDERKSQLTLSTPFNFVSTADIVGGNSGSPVINRQGELVGIIFDGNIESLVLDYMYTEKVARAVAVHSAGILEALRKIYQANRLVEEITGKK